MSPVRLLACVCVQLRGVNLLPLPPCSPGLPNHLLCLPAHLQSTLVLQPSTNSAPAISFFQYSVSVAASLETSSGALWWSVGLWCCSLSAVFIFVLHSLLRPSPATLTVLLLTMSTLYILSSFAPYNLLSQCHLAVQNLQPSQKVTSEIFEGHFLSFCNLKFLSSKQSILELCFICLAPEPETIKLPCELQS